jgi:hypothetical protein
MPRPAERHFIGPARTPAFPPAIRKSPFGRPGTSRSVAGRVSVPLQRAAARCGRNPEKPALRSTAQGDDAPPLAQHDPDPVCPRACAAECGPVATIDDLARGGAQDIYPSFAHDLAPSATVHRTVHFDDGPDRHDGARGEGPALYRLPARAHAALIPSRRHRHDALGQVPKEDVPSRA